ncbi:MULTISPECIES: lipoate--protein ligase [unclassified Lentimicrobium]|uniref:lipoate--protein ligase n=1 Tax=unclassified Lentimicrobium TaxID=2677434 RepID=UPI0015576ADB|nr:MULTISPECIES: lipoate--protein ligase [unclassified Lentimicrobium]NPD45022.1 lipoate--protein ligase [Lentimicrobium sp. S6]NPD86044.1 lipoate--protein ligase [Lentimicrobium sp. L6]
MLCLRSKTNNPVFNIATEEYLLKHKDEDCFYLYINNPSIIIGKHQNSLAEINVDYVKENEITVVRRLSGGGAVFHDPGNLNFSFIKTKEKNEPIDFRKYTQPILDVLNALGVDAKFEGRNDLTIKGKKFSGNAKHIYQNKILQHGTLLFSSKLPDLSQALKINPLKYQDKAVKSVRSRVTNISEHLSTHISLEAFEDHIINHVRSIYDDTELYELTETDIAAINQLVDEKYSTWNWNFGSSPKYNFQKGIKTTGGHIELNLEVRKGEIVNAKIFGDFFNTNDIDELEKLIIGMPHDLGKIKAQLQQIELGNYLANVTLDEFMEAFV